MPNCMPIYCLAIKFCLLFSGDFGFNPGVSAIPEVNLDDILFDQNADQVEVQPMEQLREQGNHHREDGFDKMRVGIDPEQHGMFDVEFNCFFRKPLLFCFLSCFLTVKSVFIN